MLIQLCLRLPAQTSPSDRLLSSDPEDVLDLQLEKKHMYLQMATNDLSSRDIREAPGNVQIITARQIEAAGARDMFEVLQLVPGLAFTAGANDQIGSAVHGLNADNGGWVMLLNGQRLNDNEQGIYSLSRNLTVENIDRVEIILGPGPIVHEEQALLGVVNIITRTADRGSYTQATIRTGLSNGDPTSTLAGFHGTYRIGKHQEIAFQAGTTRGHRSNVLYHSSLIGPISFRDSTATRSANFNFNYRWKDVKAFLIFMDQDQQVSDAPYSIHSRDVIMGLRQRITIGGRLELIYRLKVAEQIPGEYTSTTDSSLVVNNRLNNRYTAGTMLLYKPLPWLSLRTGITAFHQRSLPRARAGATSNSGIDPRIITNRIGAYAEMNINNKFGSFTAGIRADHDVAGAYSMAPQFAYTKTIGRFHGKFMHGRSFRMMQASSIGLHTDEMDLPVANATTSELEIGTRLNDHGFLTISGYETKVSTPTNDPSSSYTLAVQGIDARLNWQTDRFVGSFGAGFHRVPKHILISNGDRPSTFYREPGIPAQRANLTIGWNLHRSLLLRGTCNWQSGMMAVPSEMDPMNEIQDEQIILGAGIIYRPVKNGRISLDAGVHDILDTQRQLIDPTSNDAVPLILNGREYTLSINYRFLQ